MPTSRLPFALATTLLLLAPRAAADEATDLAAARSLFQRNIAAIQQRDREAYLACYLDSERLVRGGPEGMAFGFGDLAAGAPATGSDDWPDELDALDLSLAWLRDGLVFGTYRYRARFGGDIRTGLSERLFLSTDDGWRIAVSTAFDAPPGVAAPPVALVGARVHTGAGGAPIDDAVIIVRDGRIETIGPRATTAIPDGVDVIDLTGRTLVPGLIDAHVHYSQTGWADGRPDTRDLRERFPYAEVARELELHPERLHRAFLASGVTAVFDVGGFPWTRRLGAATELSETAPHVAAAGPLLATWVPEQVALPAQQQFVLVESVEQVRATVASHAAAGSDAIKFWFIVRGPDDVAAGAPLLLAAGEAARAVGLPLIVHATQLEAARVALQAGAHLLVHSVDDAPLDDAFVELLLSSGALYCPTLTVMDGYTSLFRGEPGAAREAQLAHVSPWVAERVALTAELGPAPGFPPAAMEAMAARMRLGFEQASRNLKRAYDAGAPIAAGTDAGNPLTLHGPSMVPELVAMQAAGLPALAVLTSATRNAARAMGRGDDLGLLAPGYVADLLVLDADPADDIAALASLTHLMRAGRLQRADGLLPR